MPTVEPTLLSACLRRVAAPGTEALTDLELIGRYAEHQDPAAFEVLVWRHGPMVWSACGRILRHQHDVEDAFQATFLALAQSAGSIQLAVAGWLHRVAVNAALKIKERRATTGLLDEVPACPSSHLGEGEFARAVDEELNRLPARHRAVFVLCCLEGKSNADAARELGCPVGTVDSRLHAARSRLRDRLSQRGFAPGVLVGLATIAPPLASMAAVLSRAPARPAIDTLARELSRTMTKGVMTMKTAATLLVVMLVGTVWAFAGPGELPAPKTATPDVNQPAVAPAAVQPARPRQPGGLLSDELGRYLTIEGVRAEGPKIETGTLMVDTVDGKKLEKPIPLVVRIQNYTLNGLDQPISTALPAGQRCVFKGFESGSMIGIPGAIEQAAREQGRKDVPMSPAAWQWRPYFAALIVVEPNGLEIPKK